MDQKRHERICVERFLEAIGKVPALIEDSEAPDFRVRFGEEVVGIEVTKALRSGELGKDSPQAQASLATRAMNRARNLYDATGAPPLHVTAAFLSHTPLSLGRVPELSRAIADFLRTHASGSEVYQGDLIEPCEHTDRMPEVYSLHFLRVPSPEYGAWAASSFAWCRTGDESDFAGVVSRKEKKIHSYRSAVPAVWLLIVVELFEAGELLSTSGPIAPFSVATAFDRVFAFHWLSGRVSEIPVDKGVCDRCVAIVQTRTDPPCEGT
jgi:hypothetical protein